VSVWRDVTGQDAAVATLQRAATDSTAMTHAWLLTGPPGSGRSVAARAFAAALEGMLPSLVDVDATRAMHAAARRRVVETYSLEALLGNSKAALNTVCANRRYT